MEIMMVNYNKLMKILKEKKITTYTIRQRALIPQGTLAKLKMCSGESMNDIEKNYKNIKMNMMEKILCVMYPPKQ